MKIKYLLQDVDSTNHIEQNLRKIQSEKALTYSNVSEDDDEIYNNHNSYNGSRNGKNSKDLKYLT
jgi:hypothetical protein